ncbi:hypothetical protein OC846_001485 [Tilletia horrida]|uniref:Uncharacterized protein n=1 Tax=Tilletia horrida TaxID=155126 RepID=A0AAN6GTS5_9BASI|nr:hypothetical protein OC845_001446 [Tilletia horrida]KAK0555933.1 hypothetical protein OC846_001485 [Tilletia horrida]KAK0568821.1 hypothetical protein OC861_001514 [Tilletia horrida]
MADSPASTISDASSFRTASTSAGLSSSQMDVAIPPDTLVLPALAIDPTKRDTRPQQHSEKTEAPAPVSRKNRKSRKASKSSASGYSSSTSSVQDMEPGPSSRATERRHRAQHSSTSASSSSFVASSGGFNPDSAQFEDADEGSDAHGYSYDNSGFVASYSRSSQGPAKTSHDVVRSKPSKTARALAAAEPYPSGSQQRRPSHDSVASSTTSNKSTSRKAAQAQSAEATAAPTGVAKSKPSKTSLRIAAQEAAVAAAAVVATAVESASKRREKGRGGSRQGTGESVAEMSDASEQSPAPQGNKNKKQKGKHERLGTGSISDASDLAAQDQRSSRKGSVSSQSETGQKGKCSRRGSSGRPEVMVLKERMTAISATGSAVKAAAEAKKNDIARQATTSGKGKRAAKESPPTSAEATFQKAHERALSNSSSIDDRVTSTIRTPSKVSGLPARPNVPLPPRVWDSQTATPIAASRGSMSDPLATPPASGTTPRRFDGTPANAVRSTTEAEGGIVNATPTMARFRDTQAKDQKTPTQAQQSNAHGHVQAHQRMMDGLTLGNAGARKDSAPSAETTDATKKTSTSSNTRSYLAAAAGTLPSAPLSGGVYLGSPRRPHTAGATSGFTSSPAMGPRFAQAKRQQNSSTLQRLDSLPQTQLQAAQVQLQAQIQAQMLVHAHAHAQAQAQAQAQVQALALTHSRLLAHSVVQQLSAENGSGSATAGTVWDPSLLDADRTPVGRPDMEQSSSSFSETQSVSYPESVALTSDLSDAPTPFAGSETVETDTTSTSNSNLSFSRATQSTSASAEDSESASVAVLSKPDAEGPVVTVIHEEPQASKAGEADFADSTASTPNLSLQSKATLDPSAASFEPSTFSLPKKKSTGNPLSLSICTSLPVPPSDGDEASGHMKAASPRAAAFIQAILAEAKEMEESAAAAAAAGSSASSVVGDTTSSAFSESGASGHYGRGGPDSPTQLRNLGGLLDDSLAPKYPIAGRSASSRFLPSLRRGSTGMFEHSSRTAPRYAPRSVAAATDVGETNEHLAVGPYSQYLGLARSYDSREARRTSTSLVSPLEPDHTGMEHVSEWLTRSRSITPNSASGAGPASVADVSDVGSTASLRRDSGVEANELGFESGPHGSGRTSKAPSRAQSVRSVSASSDGVQLHSRLALGGFTPLHAETGSWSYPPQQPTDPVLLADTSQRSAQRELQEAGNALHTATLMGYSMNAIDGQNASSAAAAAQVQAQAYATQQIIFQLRQQQAQLQMEQQRLQQQAEMQMTLQKLSQLGGHLAAAAAPQHAGAGNFGGAAGQSGSSQSRGGNHANPANLTLPFMAVPMTAASPASSLSASSHASSNAQRMVQPTPPRQHDIANPRSIGKLQNAIDFSIRPSTAPTFALTSHFGSGPHHGDSSNPLLYMAAAAASPQRRGKGARPNTSASTSSGGSGTQGPAHAFAVVPRGGTRINQSPTDPVFNPAHRGGSRRSSGNRSQISAAGSIAGTSPLKGISPSSAFGTGVHSPMVGSEAGDRSTSKSAPLGSIHEAASGLSAVGQPRSASSTMSLPAGLTTSSNSSSSLASNSPSPPEGEQSSRQRRGPRSGAAAAIAMTA